MFDGNFYRLFETQVERDPPACALELDTGETISRRWLHDLSGRYASALVALGCGPGDRIAVQVEKSPYALALYLACVRAGLWYLPLNTAYRSSELAYLLEDAQPALFFQGGATNGTLNGDIVPPATRAFSFDLKGEGSFAPLAELAAAAFPTQRLSEEATAALLYTSGTTGRPKGAIISHRAMSYCARTLGELWRFTPSDTLLHTLPIFHGHGLFISTNVALANGARLLLHPKFEVSDVLRALPRASVFMGVPTYYHRLLANPSLTGDLCGNVRLFISGSAPLSVDVHRNFEARTGHRILERYGATEAMILCANPADGERRPGSVGLPIPGVELRVSDEADAALPTGSVGMIQVRGAGLFSGYWNKPEQTRQEFTSDGFFRTGDLGKIDCDGYVWITGRAKDLIISGGYNVYPAEVESIINELPSVRESAVVGTPHPDFGESVVAFVIPSDNSRPPMPTDIIQQAKSCLANYKVPKQVFVVDDLPRNTMGKILKNELRSSLATAARTEGVS
ncbi:AMP-binding protein [Bradyrhizobium sp. PRIMUS42]|uniref:AMP-binding protein n=1 Tax=Bradyrhizobium sp. PRIMUS42 TaxID=2908926 RepID=UPI001FF30CDD|nr:AMP-binding protein [Bradyrhizobium sp. PRIMUS42]MCJ9728649.1 AMP-binding protein [Bradyrhizobium sp. PRIMUS42]